MYETARLGVSCAAMAANGSAPTAAAPPCVDPASIHSILLSLIRLSGYTSHNDQHLFPLTLRMPAKSSAKLGEVKGHRGESGRRGSEVRRERGAPLAGAACMHSPPAQSDGRPDAECNADSVESLAGSAITLVGAEPSDGCGDRRCGQQSR